MPAEAAEEVYVPVPCPEILIGKEGLIAVSVSGYLIFECSPEFTKVWTILRCPKVFHQMPSSVA